MKKSLKIILIAITLTSLAACTAPSQRKKNIARFILQHPVAALAIGMKSPDAENITSNAVRFSTNVGFADNELPNGRGTQVNALRHTLWQATIASRFGADTARQVGDAYERDSNALQQHQDRFDILYKADESIDLNNNAIGRKLGEAHPNIGMKEMARKILAYDNQLGLWKATAHEDENGKPYWTIAPRKMSDADYQKALSLLEQLDCNGKPLKQNT